MQLEPIGCYSFAVSLLVCMSSSASWTSFAPVTINNVCQTPRSTLGKIPVNRPRTPCKKKQMVTMNPTTMRLQGGQHFVASLHTCSSSRPCLDAFLADPWSHREAVTCFGTLQTQATPLTPCSEDRARHNPSQSTQGLWLFRHQPLQAVPIDTLQRDPCLSQPLSEHIKALNFSRRRPSE